MKAGFNIYFLCIFSFLLCQNILSQKKEIHSCGNIMMFQYSLNTLNNPYDDTMEVVGITKIPPKTSKTFETAGQDSVLILVGDYYKNVKLLPNKKPKINIEKIIDMNENSGYRELSEKAGYRFSIDDDFPGQLEVKTEGQVLIKYERAHVYTLTLNAFKNKKEYEDFTEENISPYKLTYTVTVTDKIAGHKISANYYFIFGWY